MNHTAIVLTVIATSISLGTALFGRVYKTKDASKNVVTLLSIHPELEGALNRLPATNEVNK